MSDKQNIQTQQTKTEQSDFCPVDALVRRQKNGVTMEELQESLVTEIGKQLKSDSKNVQLLDVLNRLLVTVSNYLLTKEINKKG